jgi:low affinity Fe/Cu permease
MQDFFRVFAFRVSEFIGSFWALMLLAASILATGYYFRFSTEWKINASLVLAVIALAVLIFLQKSQNHNDKATHLKLDELIKASEGARNEIASVEMSAEKDMKKLREDDPGDL